MSTTPAVTIDDLRIVSPALAKYTEDAIVRGIFERPNLSKRDRYLITVAAMVASERTVGFAHYFNLSLDNGIEPAELSETLVQLAFYAGWSTAFSAVAVLKDIFVARGIRDDQLPAATPDLLPVSEALPNDGARSAMLEDYYGAIVPGLVENSNQLLYGDVWRRPGLSPRDRTLVTIVAMIAQGTTDVFEIYLPKATETGITQTEVSEAIAHLAFYIGWPKAFGATDVAKRFYKITTA